MTVNRRLKASTLSIGSSKTSNTHQGTEDRSFSKQALEKCLNERRETRVGIGCCTVKLEKDREVV